MTEYVNRHDVPTESEIRAETNPTRRGILSAMVRMVEGRGKSSRLSVAGLAKEAGIDRGQLTTGTHKDLGARMLRIAEASVTVQTVREQEMALALAAANDRASKAKSRCDELRRDRDLWRARFERLAQDAVLLSAENVNMANRLAAARARVDRKERLHSVD